MKRKALSCRQPSLSLNCALSPFCILSRLLATGHRVVYDNFSTHSKEIA
jgi:hypothetical protein